MVLYLNTKSIILNTLK